MVCADRLRVSIRSSGVDGVFSQVVMQPNEVIDNRTLQWMRCIGQSIVILYRYRFFYDIGTKMII